MSRRFKRPASLRPEERRANRDVRYMAMAIEDQAQLDRLLDGANPALRRAMIERLMPYLRFDPVFMSEACPVCGIEDGAITAHECVGPN